MFLTEREESLNELLCLLNHLNDLIIENVEELDKRYECNINGNVVYFSIYELLNMIINDYRNVVLNDCYNYLG